LHPREPTRSSSTCDDPFAQERWQEAADSLERYLAAHPAPASGYAYYHLMAQLDRGRALVNLPKAEGGQTGRPGQAVDKDFRAGATEGLSKETDPEKSGCSRCGSSNPISTSGTGRGWLSRPIHSSCRSIPGNQAVGLGNDACGRRPLPRQSQDLKGRPMRFDAVIQAHVEDPISVSISPPGFFSGGRPWPDAGRHGGGAGQCGQDQKRDAGGTGQDIVPGVDLQPAGQLMGFLERQTATAKMKAGQRGRVSSRLLSIM